METIKLNCLKLWTLLQLPQCGTVVNKCNVTWQIALLKKNKIDNFPPMLLA